MLKIQLNTSKTSRNVSPKFYANVYLWNGIKFSPAKNKSILNNYTDIKMMYYKKSLDTK